MSAKFTKPRARKGISMVPVQVLQIYCLKAWFRGKMVAVDNITGRNSSIVNALKLKVGMYIQEDFGHLVCHFIVAKLEYGS